MKWFNPKFNSILFHSLRFFCVFCFVSILCYFLTCPFLLPLVTHTVVVLAIFSAIFIFRYGTLFARTFQFFFLCNVAQNSELSLTKLPKNRWIVALYALIYIQFNSFRSFEQRAFGYYCCDCDYYIKYIARMLSICACVRTFEIEYHEIHSHQFSTCFITRNEIALSVLLVR